MCSDCVKENAIKIYTLDSLESLDNFNKEIRELRKRYTKGDFRIKVTNRLILRNDEKILMKDTPSNIVAEFNKESTCPPISVMNYFVREVYVHIVDRKNQVPYSIERFNRITFRYDNHILEVNEIPNDYSSKKEFNLIKKDLNLLIGHLVNECDLTKDELRLMSDYFKESSYRIGSLINS